MKKGVILRRFFLPAIVLLAACQPQAALPSTATVPALSGAHILPTMTSTPSLTATLSPSPQPTATSTSSPTWTASPSPTPTLFPLPTLEGPVVACSRRRPDPKDLWPVVTATYGLDQFYVPPDLVKLGDYLPGSVTLPTMLLRQEAAQALSRLVKAMRADGLKPTVLSSYRSYVDQVVAHDYWMKQDPANADQISALPGHSEHQLGLVVDFGSPGLPALTGSTTDKFSPLFADTAEGQWLDQHAYEYGFSMSNPEGAQVLTGLAYEPWHYRYVGVDLATYLHQTGEYPTEYLLKVRPLPCTP